MSGKILIVDDSPSTRMLMKFSLQKQGFFVFEASDGESALEVLSKNTEIKILVTDINMPVMDGIELIKRVRDLTDYRYVPIVVFTNPNSPESKKKQEMPALQVG